MLGFLKLGIAAALTFCPISALVAQDYGSLFGYNGTAKGPVGFSYGGMMGQNARLMMWMRFTPMNLEKLTGTNVDKDFHIEDGKIVGDLDSNDFFSPTGGSYIRRFSMGYIYGRKMNKRLFWYAGLGFGLFQKHIEHDKFFLGSYSDTYGIVDMDHSAKGLESDVGVMLTVAEGLIITGGVSTVNFAFKKVGIDPSFGLLFIMYNNNSRVREFNKYRIK